MFNKLVASTRSNKAWNPGTVILSVVAHLLVVAAIVVATQETEDDAPPPPKPEEVTYVDVSQIPPPPEVVEPEEMVEEPTPTPAPQAPAPRTPRVRPPTPNPNEVAGTQELRNPPVITGIPDPDVAAPPVRAEDFGGRGTIGGTAAGTPPPVPPATSATGGTGPAGGTYSSTMVDRQAELLNRETVARRLQQLYPPLLRDAGVTGTVSVQFVVTPEGRVEESSIKILSSSHDAFSDAARKILKDLRFRPAQVGNTKVRMLTVMPVRWNLQN